MLAERFKPGRLRASKLGIFRNGRGRPVPLAMHRALPMPKTVHVQAPRPGKWAALSVLGTLVEFCAPIVRSETVGSPHLIGGCRGCHPLGGAGTRRVQKM